ncbi:glyoxalase/bleomycin resistance/dioxygenase family protein [Rhodanobacter sp. AS-Z3]|uniref:VOC family protein n=1 Tax=Rhodanobacter sp. AS-Z3 TaxID=3031330 RepID=UPI00247AAAF5|nr:VOC family protein [Rhodanobacter sp. AS-Z3]WEN14027.1 glyoxalase/bleomycin resistance/dioxygenase family protein [Rhodanobacter sp. AS-Z3]
MAEPRPSNQRVNTRPKPSAVVFAKHVAKLARFYRDVAGMEEIHADTSHVVLDGGHFQLVVHNIPPKIAASIEITGPPRIRDSIPIKICLPVLNIHDARILAATLGGKVGAKKDEWQARGFTACDGYDPEGNVFQVRESAP